MPREKMPDNLQDFTTMYMQRPIAKIIEELFILKTNSRELKVTNQKLAKNDPSKLKEEIKRLREIEKKYNKIMASLPIRKRLKATEWHYKDDDYPT